MKKFPFNLFSRLKSENTDNRIILLQRKMLKLSFIVVLLVLNNLFLCCCTVELTKTKPKNSCPCLIGTVTINLLSFVTPISLGFPMTFCRIGTCKLEVSGARIPAGHAHHRLSLGDASLVVKGD